MLLRHAFDICLHPNRPRVPLQVEPRRRNVAAECFGATIDRSLVGRRTTNHGTENRERDLVIADILAPGLHIIVEDVRAWPDFRHPCYLCCGTGSWSRPDANRSNRDT